jgi:hypothetical protein
MYFMPERWLMPYRSSPQRRRILKDLFGPSWRREHIKLNWCSLKILLQLKYNMLLQTASWDWGNRTIRKSFSLSISILFLWQFSSWVTRHGGPRAHRTETGGWVKNAYLSHSINLFCMLVPNVTNASREMNFWNVCLANWSKGYSLWSPNAIIALAIADLRSFCFLRLLGSDLGLAEFRHTSNGNLTALGV